MATFRKFKPLFDRILVQRLIPETKTKGGVLIPEKSQQKVNEAMVVAVGAGARDSTGKVHEVAVKSGDKVLLPEFGGTKVTFEQQDYFIFRESDILGVLEKPDSRPFLGCLGLGLGLGLSPLYKPYGKVVFGGSLGLGACGLGYNTG